MDKLEHGPTTVGMADRSIPDVRAMLTGLLMQGVVIKIVRFSRSLCDLACWGIRRLAEGKRIPASSWLRDLQLTGLPGSF